MAAARRVDPLFGLYIRVMVATGARRAEVCGLRWSDVDFDDGLLTVERSYSVVPGARGDRPTKTRSARRIVLDPATVEDLAEGWQRARELAAICGVAIDTRRAGYIFTADPTGTTAWRPDAANVLWAKTRKEGGAAAGIRLHDLRHFQATQLLDAGIPVPTVAARLGHSDGTTTMKIYAHRTRGADERAATVVANLFAVHDDR